MTNLEKRELRQYCRQGLDYDHIRGLVDCSDGTIKKYLKIFSPQESGELNG